MDFNIFLARFGLSPDNFVNKLNEPIPFEKGFIYEIEEQKRNVSSPCCHEKAYINNYKTIEYNCSNIEYIDDIIRIKRIRYKCSKCGKTFTLKLDGIPRNIKSKLRGVSRKLIYGKFNVYYKPQGLSTLISVDLINSFSKSLNSPQLNIIFSTLKFSTKLIASPMWS